MNIAEPFIRRPVMTTLLMAAVMIFGALAFTRLPVAELPAVDFPTLTVSASLPGADPETMASAVATPLENQFSTVAGIDSMTSTSSQGQTRITLQFALERDIDAAAQDVQAAVSSALRSLPDDLPSPPTVRKVNPADSPVLYVALSSAVLPLDQVTQYAEGQLARRMSTIPGVAEVAVYGSQKFAVRLHLDPDALAARGIGLDEATAAVTQANVNRPTGSLNSATRSMVIHADGQLLDADAFARQIIAYRNGAPVRFADVGDITRSIENDKVAGWYNENRAVVLAVRRQPGSNTIAVVDAVRDVLPAFAAQLPPAMTLDVLYDRSTSIRASVASVESTLIEACVLVVLVIFLFLRNLSATIIPSLALPIAVVGTFAGMHLLGFSLNNLSLLALTLAVGFVVDDAIVMLENIVRHLEAGEKPFEAALKGAREVGFTILSMTVSLAAVFIPFLFMGGIIGRLLNEFAVTVVLAILVSGVVSVTLTPMLCSRMLRTHGTQAQHGALFRWTERLFDGFQSLYALTLRWSLRWHGVTFAVFLGTVVLAGYLFTVVAKDFLPSEDNGQIIASTEGLNGASFPDMVAHQQMAKAVVLANPNVDGVMSSVGAGGPRATANSGTMLIRLKPRDQREASASEVVQQLRPKLAQIPGISVFLQVPPPIRIGGMSSKAAYQYTLQDIDLDRLYDGSMKLAAALSTVPGFQDVTSNLDRSTPALGVRILRDRAAALGVTPAQIEGALSAAFSSGQVSTIYTASDQYAVILELAPRFREAAEALDRLYVRASTGALVPLSSVTERRSTTVPLTVNHLGQLPAVTLSFNLAPGVSLSEAVERLKDTERQIGLADTVQTSFQGTAQAFQQSMTGMGMLLGMAVLVVYIVLGILYESFIHPLTILSGLPSAAVGALATLALFDMPLSLYGFVGVVMLVGIVKKNAIMMIDFALVRERADGLAPRLAIEEAALVRFRPIMMTTMAALMGTLPIALGEGAGSESRQPLGLAVVGGLVVSQVLTLYVTPVLYIYLDRAAGVFRRRPAAGSAALPAHPAG